MSGTKKGLRIALIAMAAAVAGVIAAPVKATLAPGATSEATALGTETVDTAVGTTHASAGEDGASADAVGARVLGTDVASSESDGNATDSDAAVKVGLPARTGGVEVMPRSTRTRSTDDRSEAESHSDLVTAHIRDLVKLEVLSSDAEAVWTPKRSSSRSQVDGAKLSLGEGDFVIVLMHAERSSNGERKLYLVQIDDVARVGFEDDDDVATIDVPGVLQVDVAGTGVRAGRFVGHVLRTAGLDGVELDTFAAAIRTTADKTAEVKVSAAAVGAGADADTSRGRLPLTGASIITMILTALTLIEAGAALTFARSALRARA